MSEPYVGEIRMFAGNFAPRGWAFCDGQLLAVSGNDALFSLLGTIYGGDGRTTFGLPDLRGRVPVHVDTNVRLGSRAGVESVTLTANQIPAHAHTFVAAADIATSPNPANHTLASSTTVDLYNRLAPDTSLSPATLSTVGGSTSHDNMMPFLGIHFIIALFGVYPSRL